MRWISAAAAVVVLGFNLLSAATLSGTTSNGGQYFPTDRLAVAGIGVFFTALTLVPWRLRVHADRDGVRVRNLLGDVTVPWEMVQRVRFDRKAVWASLELTNGEVVALLAVQVFDGERSVAAVRRLRQLHTDSRQPDQATSRR
ncbi:PH domain-containing protein [Micromonospora endolithica]|uniref:PH domain-containing protein n=1 Tax=Micromonospora endolithica TaxID=230091 RepID=UPI001EDDD370|nr:PH domain-containing protein [Micromonospora endolithica]